MSKNLSILFVILASAILLTGCTWFEEGGDGEAAETSNTENIANEEVEEVIPPENDPDVIDEDEDEDESEAGRNENLEDESDGQGEGSEGTTDEFEYVIEGEVVEFEPDSGNYLGFSVCDYANSTCTVYGVTYDEIAKATKGEMMKISFNEKESRGAAAGTGYFVVVGDVEVEPL